MYNLQQIAQKFNKSPFYKGLIELNKPLAPLTTMKVGGAADLFVSPQDNDSFIEALKICQDSQVDFFILGGGSNLVVSDNGIKDRVVISTALLNKIKFSLNDKKAFVTCQSGTTMEEFVDFCAKYGFTGAENFGGLPGTCGGSTYMNARCYDKNACDLISSVEFLDSHSITVKEYSFNPADWDYKKSPFTGTKDIVLSITYLLDALDQTVLQDKKEAPEDIQRKITEANCHYIEDRREKGHFKAPSAGSVFKNNRSFGSPSGVLVDKAGLKGLQHGGAQIAPWHGNFIINTGNATAEDIRNLVKTAQEKVFQMTGFNMENEIIFV